MRPLHLLLAYFTFALGSTVLMATDIPRPHNNYVNDFAQQLTASETDQLRNRLSSIEHDTGIEISIAVIRSKAAFSHHGSIEALARLWFNDWGVGNMPRNDGIFILLAIDDREVRIELGKAYGHNDDDAMQSIINDAMLPAFRRHHYADGLNQAIDHLQAFATQRTSSPGVMHAREQKRSPQIWWLGGILGAGGLSGLLFAYQHRKRYKPRQCSQCQSPMQRLSERIDDRYLNDGQIAEEKVGSVDYDVWKCTQCPHHQVEHYRTIFRSARECPRCKRQTAINVNSVHGHGHITEYWLCKHCQHNFQKFREVRAHTTRGFGGGSSGGGGATGRW